MLAQVTAAASFRSQTRRSLPYFTAAAVESEKGSVEITVKDIQVDTDSVQVQGI